MNNPNASKAGLVAAFGRATAAVVALTALVGALVALVVAVRDGWNEVGPFFKSWLSAAPAVESSGTELDPNLVAALSSGDSEVRRGARIKLADAVARARPEALDALLLRIERPEYRTRLGIAYALARAPGGWRPSDPAAARQRLQAMAMKVNDPQTRRELSAAANNIRT